MKDTKRISFDVPLEDHTFLKIECAKAHIALRDFMKEMFDKTLKEFKQKQLHENLIHGFQESYEGKSKPLMKEDLDRWEKVIDESSC